MNYLPFIQTTELAKHYCLFCFFSPCVAGDCSQPSSVLSPVMAADRFEPQLRSLYWIISCELRLNWTMPHFLFIFMLYLTSVRYVAMVQVLIFCDVLVWDQEQNHLTLLVLYGHNVEQTPELRACGKNRDLNTPFKWKLPCNLQTDQVWLRDNIFQAVLDMI